MNTPDCSHYDRPLAGAVRVPGLPDIVLGLCADCLARSAPINRADLTELATYRSN